MLYLNIRENEEVKFSADTVNNSQITENRKYLINRIIVKGIYAIVNFDEAEYIQFMNL